MTSPIAALQLLQQLLKRTSRQSKTFDKYQPSFLKKLQNSSSHKTTEALYEQCIEQLITHVSPTDDYLLEGRLIASQSLLQLQKLANLSQSTEQKIETAKGTDQPYTILDHHNELTHIIKIYQRVIIELDKECSASNVTHESSPIEGITDELQQVIMDLDVSHNYRKNLEAIRNKISLEENPLLLPQYCLQVIAIVVDSTREERRASRHFLYTLNESLAQVYLKFSKNLKRTELAFEKQEGCIDSIHEQSMILKEETLQANDLASLQQNIFHYIENVEAMVKAREAEKEGEVRQELQGMIRQIKVLQNETNNYQKTLKQKKQQLSTDFLTKIPNRAAWSERLKIEFTRFQRYQHTLNIAVIDIDKFKMINDTFGHLAGDKVLNVIAQSLQKSIRNTDFIARYGGEEFALLLPDISEKQAQVALQKLCAVIKNIPFKFKKESISITISIGFTEFREQDNIDNAFERADQALYHAKRNGRDQVVYFEESHAPPSP